jgi:Uncharacterised methyltransferase family (DUF6094)
MARNNSRVKLGYFPLETDLANGIRARLNFPANRFIALDPCCGTGSALFLMTSSSTCSRFGIEVDRVRAKAAESTFYTVLNGDFESAIIEGECQLLYLNPPYDQEVGTRVRVEESFLERGTPCLAPGGMLILAIPLRVLAGLIKPLCSRFHSVRIVQGDPVYSQILVFAVRAGENEPFDGESYRSVDQAARSDWEALPGLSEGEWSYSIPEPNGVKTFLLQKEALVQEDVVRALLGSNVLKSLVDSPLSKTPVEDRPLQILHPLTEGMTALLLLAGYFDGMIFDTDDPRCSVVKGSTVFHRLRREVETETGIEITDIDAPVSRVTVAHLESRTISDLLPESITVFGDNR